MIAPSQRPLPAQHPQETNIHALSGIGTHDSSNLAAGDPCIRQRGHQDRYMDGDSGCLILCADHGTFSSLLLCSFWQTTVQQPGFLSQIDSYDLYLHRNVKVSLPQRYRWFLLKDKAAGARSWPLSSNSNDDKKAPSETSYNAAFYLRYLYRQPSLIQNPVFHCFTKFLPIILTISIFRPAIPWPHRARSSRIRQPEREGDHLPTSTSKIKNMWSYTSFPPHTSSQCCS